MSNYHSSRYAVQNEFWIFREKNLKLWSIYVDVIYDVIYVEAFSETLSVTIFQSKCVNYC